ncbi:MAG: molecular chaperone [Alteromonadales bacterium]|nr:molecular chaperone [Alteromonadales bacterium]MCP4984715.1 molecular chaperone [Colwellia sp.]
MRLSSLFMLIISIFINLVCSINANASLLISPTRVVINDRERSSKVVLINTGTKTRTYRVGWAEKRALSQGGYYDLNAEEAKGFPTASNMFRVSPKQVTLVPGQRQIIKLLARRPKGLADGEYRSHLKFTVLPSSDKEEEGGPGSVKLKVLLNYTIPAILRQGENDFNVSVKNIKLDVNKEQKRTTIIVDASRSGSASTFGNFKAYWTPTGSNKESRVGELNAVNFYPEVKQSSFKLFWQNDDFNLKKGKLRVTYEGGKEYRNIIFAEKTIQL